jgi:hypothetical protein
MNLTATTESLEVVTTTTAAIDYVIDYTIIDKSGASTVTTADSAQGQITSATTTSVMAAPGASISYVVTGGTWRNTGAAANVVTIQKDVSAANRIQWSGTLAANESVSYTRDAGWQRLNADGYPVTTAPTTTGTTGRVATFHKSGTAADAVGYWYCSSKDGGFPGAWAPGTPGLAGRATDGTTAADNGCVPFVNATTGGIYLTGLNVWSSVAQPHIFFDCLWVNSGIVVTTTTAQTINSVTFPARDVNGTTNGEGLMIGLLFVAAATNAAVNNTATVSYTNSDGTAGRTATLENVVGQRIPATPVIGTLVWFKLAAGDKGVRSIQSVTLATSLVTGTVSLIVARWMPQVSTTVVGVGADALGLANPGVRLYNGTTLLHCYRASATTATVVGGTLTMMER